MRLQMLKFRLVTLKRCYAVFDVACFVHSFLPTRQVLTSGFDICTDSFDTHVRGQNKQKWDSGLSMLIHGLNGRLPSQRISVSLFSAN